MPSLTFRDAFLLALEQNNVSMAEISRRTGVSLEQMKKLKQGKTQKTNVEDAMKIATYFGQSLEKFIGNPELVSPIRIVQIYNELQPEKRQALEAYASGLRDAQDRPQSK